MKIRAYIFLIIVLILSAYSAAQAKIDVVTTTRDLADIARSIGGDKVSVTALAPGNQDPHLVEPRPSMVTGLRKADMLVRVGMDLDVWVQGLVDSARNRNIVNGDRGYADASVGIKKLEIPRTKLDPSQGHIHIHGNPHYWLDPTNGKIIAKNIMNGLIRVSPGDSSYFKSKYADYCKKLDSAMARRQKTMAPYKGSKVVTYHKSFVYFLNRYGLVDYGQVEPKPGIPPSPSHLNSLINKMKSGKAKLIMMEPFYSRKSPDMVARQVGAEVVVVPTSVGGAKGVDSYIELFDYMVDRVSKALK